MHHIRKMHCQQFTLKYITLPYQILWAKPILSPGLISLHYSEFVSNKQSNVSPVSGPFVAVGPRTNVPAGPPFISPGLQRKKQLVLPCSVKKLVNHSIEPHLVRSDASHMFFKIKQATIMCKCAKWDPSTTVLGHLSQSLHPAPKF